MHGVILYHLRQFTVERFGLDAWISIQTAAGFEDRVYVPVRVYPDSDFDGLLVALEQETGLQRKDLLEGFGEWSVVPLFNMYRALIPRHWRAREFFLNVDEQVLQKIVRLKDPQARTTRFDVCELAPGVLEIAYQSRREMAALLFGMLRGVLDHFGEQGEIIRSDAPAQEYRFIVRLAAARSKPEMSLSMV